MLKSALLRVRAQTVSHLLGPALVRAGSLRSRVRRLLGRGRGGQRSPDLAPPLASMHRLRDLLSRYYLDGRYVEGARPVAWVTSGAPVEVLRALGYYVVYPEKNAALHAARHQGAALAEVAEQSGFHGDLCSYARIDLGSTISGRSVFGKVPRPDLLVACTNICQTVLYWYKALSRITAAPLFVIDTPFVRSQPRHHQRIYVRDQIRDLALCAARLAGRPLKTDRLEQAIDRSRRAVLLWRELLELSRNRPAPWNAFDMFLFMAPIVILRGLPEPLRFYRDLKKELECRVSKGQASIRHETHRLLWDNLPLWFWLRPMSEIFAARSAAIVGATYTYAWAAGAELLDPTEPYMSMADVYLQVYLNQDLESRRRLITRLCRDFAVEGVLFHADRSCKPYSMGQQEIAEGLQRDLGIRSLVFEGDHGDERQFAEEAVRTRIEAFLESLG